MADGAPGSQLAGMILSAQMVIEPDTATATIPPQPTVVGPAAEVAPNGRIAMNVAMVMEDASIDALTIMDLTRVPVTLVINNRHGIGNDAIVSVAGSFG